MLPMMSRVIAGQKKWATEEELLNYYAVAQCTPGIIAVNTATFVGAKQKGVLGAVAATLGVVFPGAVIIIIIAVFLENFSHYEIVQNAFAGIRIAVSALITVSVFRLVKNTVNGILAATAASAAFVLVAFLGISPVIIALGAIVLGVAYSLIAFSKNRGKTK